MTLRELYAETRRLPREQAAELENSELLGTPAEEIMARARKIVGL